MRWLLFIPPWWILFFVAFVNAEIYRYVDENGVPHFTNDLSTVPEKKIPEITEGTEYKSSETDNKAFELRKSGQSRPRTHRHDYSEENRKQEALRKQNLKAQKEALDAEYRTLLKEKAEIDGNEGFQKRRDKNKYKHRPHIEALVKREEELKKRLAEIEAEIKRIESQM